MAIEFQHKGTKYRADTPAEAVALRMELERRDAAEGDVFRHSAWTPDLAEELINGIGELQKKFLAVLCERATPTKSKTVAERMGLDSEIALAGAISGLSKQLRKMSLTPRHVYAVDVEWKGKSKERSFSLLEDFREALTELGWPDAWVSTEKGATDAASTKEPRK
ncbi:MAG: hypothetical protein ABSG52_12855 [Terriglobales bacterium]|jgi:hypothetical protein